MTKAERELFISDRNYFEGIKSALRVGVYPGEDAKNLWVLQMTTIEKLKQVQAKLDEENKRIEKLINEGVSDGTPETASAG